MPTLLPRLPALPLLAKALREPLVHFLVIGAAVFVLYGLVAPEGETAAPRERIVVSEGRVAQLATLFTRTWQRAPTEEELQGLVEGYVKEEVYYREAVKLGLDGDDTVVRRRMQQKMEFLIEPPEEVLQAGDAELQAYLETHREVFRAAPQVTFRQVFVRAGEGREAALERASLLLDALRGGAPDGAAGDPSLLPGEMRDTSLRLVARNFGEDFAAALAELPAGAWHGPVASAYGLHLVRVEDLTAGYDPALDEVRDLVLQAWQHERRQAFAEEAYRRLRTGYEVVLPAEGAAAGAQSE